jgi:hypothetical protein
MFDLVDVRKQTSELNSHESVCRAVEVMLALRFNATAD